MPLNSADLHAAFDLATRMRAAQREFFRNRDNRNLEIAKRLEHEFDDLAKRMLNPPAPQLFG